MNGSIDVYIMSLVISTTMLKLFRTIHAGGSYCMEDLFVGRVDDRHIARGGRINPFAVNVQSAAEEITT